LAGSWSDGLHGQDALICTATAGVLRNRRLRLPGASAGAAAAEPAAGQRVSRVEDHAGQRGREFDVLVVDGRLQPA